MAKRKKTKNRKAEDVIKAFKEGVPLRTSHLKAYRNAWWHARGGVRDEVKVEDGCVTYYLWGSPIATLKDGILTLDNCGYETQLTGTRLRDIGCEFDELGYSPESLVRWLTGKGWFWGEYQDIEPYPLRVDLKKQKVLNVLDPEKYYRKLLRAKDPYRINELHSLCKRLGPIPPDLEDEVVAKLMAIKLTEAA